MLVQASPVLSLLLKGSSFVNGNSGDLGGGASINASASSVGERTFQDNTAKFGGGGLHAWQAKGLSLKSSLFETKSADEESAFFASALGDLRSLENLGRAFNYNQNGVGASNLYDLSKLGLRVSGNTGKGNDAGGIYHNCDAFHLSWSALRPRK